MNVGNGTELGESIIQDVKGVNIVIQRSLRDVLHLIPNTEVAIKVLHSILVFGFSYENIQIFQFLY